MVLELNRCNMCFHLNFVDEDGLCDYCFEIVGGRDENY